MKLINKILFLLVCFLFINSVSATSNPYGKYQDLYGEKTIRCTWYAWQQAYDNLNIALPGWGNAQTWYNSAISSGYSVGKEPKENSIAVYSSSDGYGHVAFVVSVDNNQGTMIVNEAGIVDVGNEGVLTNVTKYTTSGNLIGFIYINEGKKQNSNYNNENDNKETLKSSNNYLKELKIENIEFEFDKDKFEYNIVVKSNIQIISIVAQAEDKKAIVNGTGEKAIKDGNNKFVIEVIAENGTKNEYIINIFKEVKKDIADNNGDFNINKKDNTLKRILIIGISIIILTNITYFLIKIIKKRKKEN